MLKSVELEKFRCFEKMKFHIRDISVVVGKNNAGKSTITEALRIISMAAIKCKQTTYTNPPQSIGLGLSEKGFRLQVERMKIDLRSVVYYYESDIAKITANFDNKTKIIIYLNSNVAFACVYDKNNNLVKSKRKAQELDIPSICILPQIGLIKENEKKLSEITVLDSVNSYLSSRHFRNEILLFNNEFYDEFKKIAEDTWRGLKIKSLDYEPNESDYINLFVEDDRFTSEIGLMGSGIQMWLQVIWFITKSKGNNTIILDEPDVYMHPDLQLKMLRLVTASFSQIIIATHSIEIISNVSPQNIVTIDKENNLMKYLNDLSAVQTVIDDIGSVHNLSLTKLSTAKKCVFVEGEDMKILQKFYNIIYPDNPDSFDIIPSLPLGGFKKINEAFGAAKLFNENAGENFKCYAVLDRDYYIGNHIESIQEKAKENCLILHVWSKKELENYLINPKVIYKIIADCYEKYEDFILKFENLVNSFKDDVIDSYTTKIHEDDRKLTAGTAASKARDYVDGKWNCLENKLSIVPGKELLKTVNKWIKDDYKVSCSMNTIFNNMELDDIDSEIKELLKKIIE